MSQVRSTGGSHGRGGSQHGGRGYGRGGRGYGRGGRGNYNNWRGGRWRGRGRGGSGGSAPRSSQPHLIQTTLDHNSPYKGWRLYFPSEGYSDRSPTVSKLQTFEKFFLSWKALYNLNEIEEKGSFQVDFKELVADQVLTENIPEFQSELQNNPEKILKCMGLAMHQLITVELNKPEPAEGDDVAALPPPAPVDVAVIHARVAGFEPVTPLKQLRANCYGKFISVKGTVVRVSNVKPMCTKMAFQCTNCAGIFAETLTEGKYVIPTKCPSEGCRSKSFNPKRNHSFTETIDWQVVRVQEIISSEHRESGRIPRTVDCHLTQDLVDSCVPGDMVTVAGIVKVISTDEGHGRNNKDKCMFQLYLQANSVTSNKGGGAKSGGGDSLGVAMEFSMKELYAVQEIHSEPHLFRLLVASLCPSIYGHEMVKAGLMLALFGGTQKYSNDKNRIPVRGDPHILVVGDPGLGKSQMLQAVAGVAPRSVYVCGNTTTTSGLTVTLSRESGSGGDFALEAGALVLGDQGCCCIDEFDKMGNQHQALLEAMEQQSISIAKAGMVCSLPARTSIVAAANPVGGHYNKAKTVSENIRMGSALLSRFDLVFILLDKPDEELDSMLSEHVMALHAGKKRASASGHAKQEISLLEDDGDSERPLLERLKIPRGESIDPIPPQLLRKYVGYARKYVQPKIGPEAATILQNFYLDLRRQHQKQDCTPITTRQLQSLIRLTEAKARAELREVATEQDAKDVVSIMKYSMLDTFTNQFGFLDFQRSQHGSGMSSRSQGKKFVALLQRVSNQTYNSMFTIPEMRQIAQDASINVRDFESFVSSLNNQGYLLKKGQRTYQLQTTDF